MLTSHESYVTILHEMAHFYRDKGWSVIPLVGRNAPEKAKLPAVAWSEYQQRQAEAAEIDDWFLRAGYGGLGIVCGVVSGLIVLDFDDAAKAKAFARSHPELTDTLTIRSGGRGLPHYYYTVPQGMRVTAHRGAGMDLQADGRYVVAPPTALKGQRWSVLRDVEPRQLTPGDLERIEAFFAVHAFDAEREPYPETPYVGENRQVSLQQWYGRLAPSIGRNNALFKVAAYARDTGWSQEKVRACLVNTHIMQPDAQGHSHETPAQRYREAVRTIHSVYQYGPRPRRQPAAPTGLPNSIRETLLQRGQAATARVLEGLRMVGVQPGTYISERITLELLQPFQIGRRAIQEALTTQSVEGQPIFRRLEQSKGQGKKRPKNYKKCFFVTGANRVKIAYSQNRVGQPPRLFIVPDTVYLCHALGIETSPSDPLMARDLQSPHHYRLGLQRALFRRRPGQYSRRWLCGRLGISVWTCRRYDRELGVNRRPMYRETVITWANIGDLRRNPAAPDGQFLETADGKRYPPLRRCAAYLLPEYGTLTLKEQSWNFYSLRQEHQPICEIYHNKAVTEAGPHRTAVTAARNISADTTPPPNAEPERSFWLCPACHNWHIRTEAPASCDKCGGTEWQWISPVIWRDPQRCTDWWRTLRQRKRTLKPAKPGDDARYDRTAGQLYATVRAMQTDSLFSYRRARELVRTYGPAHVDRVLRLLGQRQQVRNPAGFVIAMLRRENKYAEAPMDTGTGAASAADGWQETEAMRALRESPYAGFYANAHTFMINDNAAQEGDVVR